MLQIIRSKVTSVFVKILFVLLIVSFAIWGIGDIFFGSPAGKVAISVGKDVRYTTQEVSREFEASRRRIGVPLTAEQAIQLGILDQVMQTMVTDGLMTAATHSLDLSIGTDRMVQFVRSRFVDATGKFDQARYQTFLANNGWSEAEFLQRLRQDFTRRQLIDALSASDPVPTPIVDRLFAYREEQRIAEVVAIPASGVAEPAAPDDKALADYFDKNKKHYEKPEYRSIAWIQVSPDSIAKTMDIPEADIRAAYDERSDQLGKPEKRDVQQILFDSEDAAKAARARIVAGEDFAAVAKDTTGTEEAGLDLGVLGRAGLPAGTADAVFALAQDAISEPVKSPFGWALFRVRSIQPATKLSFDEAKKQLRDELAHEKALDQVYEVANKLEDSLAGGSTLEEASKALGLTVQTVEGLEHSGALKSGGKAENLPGGRFLQVAFDTAQGQKSSLGEGDKGSFFVLRVDGVEAPRIPALDEVKDQAVADWKAERRLEAAEKQADGLAEKVKEGGDLTVLAAVEEHNVKTLPAMTRAGHGLEPGYPKSLPSILFDIKAVGGVSVTSDDTQAVVVRLKSIEPADPKAEADARKGIDTELAQGTESDVIELLLADLRSRFGVTVDKEKVVRLYGSAQ